MGAEYLDSLDIANRACQLLGVEQIDSPTEDSSRNKELSLAYGKLRRAEMRRNVWRFAVRKAALRALDGDTLTLAPAPYDSSKTYLAGEVAKDQNGQVWISVSADNQGNAPGGNNEAWESYYGPLTVDQWDSALSYYSGELVYVVTGVTPNGYQIYMSLMDGNTGTPGTGTAWSATTQYKQNDVVSYSGSNWRSLLAPNINNTPADGPAAWSAATSYTIGNQVTGSDNYVYTAAGSTTGNDPVSDAGVHWTNTGNLNAWSRAPTLISAGINWRPIVGTLSNAALLYPLTAGPLSQTGTRNAFRLPSGFLREAPQMAKPGLSAPLGGPLGVTYDDWEYDGQYIVSSMDGAFIYRFVADITRVASMDDMFCEGLAYRMALATCMKLTQSDTKLQTIASAYKLFMGEARLVNGIEAGSVVPPDDEFLTVRY